MIVLARMMVERLDSLVIDVETAFLYGEIDEEIFMKSEVEWEHYFIYQTQQTRHLQLSEGTI